MTHNMICIHPTALLLDILFLVEIISSSEEGNSDSNFVALYEMQVLYEAFLLIAAFRSVKDHVGFAKHCFKIL
jgi:hypothetical protein